jgi:hypothetical protein
MVSRLVASPMAGRQAATATSHLPLALRSLQFCYPFPIVDFDVADLDFHHILFCW